MVFAINKIDKPNANPDHIKEQLSQMNYLVESWGGKYQDQEVSAKKGLNLDKAARKVPAGAEMLDLKANPNKKAQGTVIESTLDKGRGYVSTILVQSGTLRVGDVILSGTYTGRVKAMFNENGKKVEAAGPSTPVQVLGLNGAPQAGDTFNVMDDDRSAREIANKREQLARMQGIMTQKHVTLDEIGRRIAIGSFKELNIIVKGDVDGSVEAMSGSLIKLSKETVQVNVIHAAVGQISESDVLLAAASNAIIVGFQVRPSASARRLAEKEEIEIRLCSIIYDAINDIKDAIEGMLEPVMKEEIVASVEVLEIFKITKVRNRRRMYGPRRQAATLDPDPRHPRRHRDLHRQTRLAQTFQGRRQGGRGRTGLRSEHRVVQRHPRRRHRRGIRTGGSETQVTPPKLTTTYNFLAVMTNPIHFTTAEEAVKVIKSGDHVHLSSVASAPSA